jgi:hypothetical protein
VNELPPHIPGNAAPIPAELPVYGPEPMPEGYVTPATLEDELDEMVACAECERTDDCECDPGINPAVVEAEMARAEFAGVTEVPAEEPPVLAVVGVEESGQGFFDFDF